MFEGLLQPMYLLIVIVIVLLFFGPQRLPEFSKGVGYAIRNFKRAINEKEGEPENVRTAAPHSQE